MITKILAILGTLMTGLPIAAPVIFAVMAFAGDGILRFDYLIPAELFPIALTGNCLLFWAAWRAHKHTKLTGLSLAAAVLFFAGGQALATITNLRTGDIETGGWVYMTVMGSIIIYTLAIIAACIGGKLLLRDLFLPDGRK